MSFSCTLDSGQNSGEKNSFNFHSLSDEKLLWSVVDNESVAVIVQAAEGSASGAAQDLRL